MNRIELGESRQGNVTGSVIGTIMRARKETLPKIAARLREQGAESFAEETHIPALRWGRDNEDRAIGALWERYPHLELDNPGYLSYHDPDSDYWLYCGGSVDRLATDETTGEKMVVEVKCPYLRHVFSSYGLCPGIPEIYMPQVHYYLWLTNLRKAMFVAFDPRATSPLIVRDLARSPEWDRRIEAALARFRPYLLAA